jgi:branched-chain amino acid transport system ATP-binding protein
VVEHLAVSGLCAGYGQATVVSDVTFKLQSGDVLAVLGPNGAGKSTLLGAIAGIVDLKGGSVRLGATEIGGRPAEVLFRAGVSLVPEGRRVFAPLTVHENLMLGQGKRFRSSSGFSEIYDLFPRLAERRRQKAGTLSGGEQQMLAMGRALISRPTLLLLDEPSLGLAPIMARLILDTIARLKSQGITMIVVEQNRDLLRGVAGPVIVLTAGNIAFQGRMSDLTGDSLRRAYLGVAK